MRRQSPDDRSRHFRFVSTNDIANYGEIAVPTISSKRKRERTNASGLYDTDPDGQSLMRAVARHSAPSGHLTLLRHRSGPGLLLGHRFQIIGNL